MKELLSFKSKITAKNKAILYTVPVHSPGFLREKYKINYS